MTTINAKRRSAGTRFKDSLCLSDKNQLSAVIISVAISLLFSVALLKIGNPTTSFDFDVIESYRQGKAHEIKVADRDYRETSINDYRLGEFHGLSVPILSPRQVHTKSASQGVPGDGIVWLQRSHVKQLW